MSRKKQLCLSDVKQTDVRHARSRKSEYEAGPPTRGACWGKTTSLEPVPAFFPTSGQSSAPWLADDMLLFLIFRLSDVEPSMLHLLHTSVAAGSTTNTERPSVPASQTAPGENCSAGGKKCKRPI